MKRKFKIILDIIMLLMTLTLFNKQFISMKYHEIAGLVLIAVVIVHIIVNIKTITAMCKKFIKVPLAIKIGLIVDILLFVCFVWIGISGILISHTILTGISSGNMIFKLLHMFIGGISVILLGLHIGLHICRKPMPSVVAIIISLVVLCGGIYGVVNSSEIHWLSMPFTVTSQRSEGPNEAIGSDKTEGTMQSEEQPNDKQHTGQGKGQGKGQRQEQGRGQGLENKEMHQPQNGGGKNRQPLSIFQKIQNAVMFLGMILSCSMITYWIAIPKKRRINSANQ